MAGFFGRRLSLPHHRFFVPIPQPPSRREGGVFWFSYARGFAPCIPGTEPERHRSRGRNPAPSGGLAPALPDNLAVAVPDGGHGGFGRRLNLPHHEFLSPIPPTRARRALFPHGEGGDFGFISPGATAPGTPAPEPGRRGGGGAILRQAGGLPRRCRITLPSLSPTGGERRFWSPAEPAVSLLFCPHPPDPRSQSALPLRGRGRFCVFLCKGLRPRHPCA